MLRIRAVRLTRQCRYDREHDAHESSETAQAHTDCRADVPGDDAHALAKELFARLLAERIV